jgi:hypothetical protein
MLDETQLGELLMSATDGGSVFRWEGLREYNVASDGGDYQRYVAGQPGPSLTRKQGWLGLLRKEFARGVRWHRVRLIRPPLSKYERYACEWGYAYNSAAGDDCRILDTSEAAMPVDPPDHDFWMVDRERIARMNYDPDGRFLGADLAPTEDQEKYLAAADALWSAAEPFHSWWDRHPEYHRKAREVT